MKLYRERTTKGFCGHWYYTQASYKGDHELSGYQPCYFILALFSTFIRCLVLVVCVYNLA